MKNEHSFDNRMTPRAIVNEDTICVVDAALVEKLKAEALSSELGRYRLCMHHSTDDPAQDMIVAHRRGNYSRPHCHPDGAMSYTMIEGRMDVFLFDDAGAVTRRIRLSCHGGQDGGSCSLRLSAGIMYMPVCLTETTVFQEVLASPNPDGVATQYPDWSPAEDEPDRIAEFYRQIGIDA